MTTPSDPPLLACVDDEDMLDLWASFLGDGHWTLTRPEMPGIYPIASREGDHVGYREFRMSAGEVVDTLTRHGEPGWQGYYWSVALPPPPKRIPN